MPLFGEDAPDFGDISGADVSGPQPSVYTLPPDFTNYAAPPPPDVTATPAAGATPGVDPTLKKIGNLLALLTLGGGFAGVGQQLFGGQPQTTVTPQLTPQALQLLSGAQAQTGQSQALLQMLLGGIQNPQLSPALSALVEKSFQPQMGDIASHAIESARRRGFAGGAELLQGGPAGAIAGPALSNLQGQMATAKLNLYQNQLNNLLSAFQGSQGIAQMLGQQATAIPSGQKSQAPRPGILDILKSFMPILAGASNVAYKANTPPSNPQQQLSQLLASLSGTDAGSQAF